MTQCVPSTALVVPGGWAAAVCSFTFVLGHARLAVRHGHRQNYDVRFMSAIGYIPATLVDAMELPGSTYRLARNARAFPTGGGHVQIVKSWKHAEGFWEVITSTFVLLS